MLANTPAKTKKALRSKALAPSPFQGEGWDGVFPTGMGSLLPQKKHLLCLRHLLLHKEEKKAQALAPSPCEGEGWGEVLLAGMESLLRLLYNFRQSQTLPTQQSILKAKKRYATNY